MVLGPGFAFPGIGGISSFIVIWGELAAAFLL